jgi:long-chain acyl-CoA synthetase
VKRETGIYGWPLHPAVRLVGMGFQAAVMVPLVHLFYRVRRTGVEHLVGLDGPVLFTPNHCLHTDNAIVLTQLPLGRRWNLAVAAGAETIYGNRVRGFLASVLANAFPLRREKGRSVGRSSCSVRGWTVVSASSSTRKAS